MRMSKTEICDQKRKKEGKDKDDRDDYDEMLEGDISKIQQNLKDKLLLHSVNSAWLSKG